MFRKILEKILGEREGRTSFPEKREVCHLDRVIPLEASIKGYKKVAFFDCFFDGKRLRPLLSKNRKDTPKPIEFKLIERGSILYDLCLISPQQKLEFERVRERTFEFVLTPMRMYKFPSESKSDATMDMSIRGQVELDGDMLVALKDNDPGTGVIVVVALKASTVTLSARVFPVEKNMRKVESAFTIDALHIPDARGEREGTDYIRTETVYLPAGSVSVVSPLGLIHCPAEMKTYVRCRLGIGDREYRREIMRDLLLTAKSMRSYDDLAKMIKS